MSRSRNRMVADWFAKIRANATTGEVEHTDVTTVETEVDNFSTSFSGLSDTTVSTTDPSITTNPSTTGHIWVNKNTGELFSCTDTTSNLNQWKSGNGGHIKPVFTHYFIQNGTAQVTPARNDSICPTISSNLSGPSNSREHGQYSGYYKIRWAPGSGYGAQRYCIDFGNFDVTDYSTLSVTASSEASLSGSGAEHWRFGFCPTGYGAGTSVTGHISSENNHGSTTFTLDVSSYTGTKKFFLAVYYEEIRVTEFKLIP